MAALYQTAISLILQITIHFSGNSNMAVLIIGDSQIKYMKANYFRKLPGNRMVTVNSNSGQKVGDVNQTFLAGLPLAKFKHIILHLGTNNVATLQTPHQICAQMEELVSNLARSSPSSVIHVSSVIPRARNMFDDQPHDHQRYERKNEKAIVLNMLMEQVCMRNNNCRFIDNRQFPGEHEELLSKDGLHLSREGVLQLAENFASSITRVEKKKRKKRASVTRATPLLLSEFPELPGTTPVSGKSCSVKNSNKGTYCHVASLPKRVTKTGEARVSCSKAKTPKKVKKVRACKIIAVPAKTERSQKLPNSWVYIGSKRHGNRAHESRFHFHDVKSTNWNCSAWKRSCGALSSPKAELSVSSNRFSILCNYSDENDDSTYPRFSEEPEKVETSHIRNKKLYGKSSVEAENEIWEEAKRYNLLHMHEAMTAGGNGCENEKDRKIHSINCNLLKCVASGDFSQCDGRFSQRSRGVQCMCISTVACTFMQYTDMNYPSKQIINDLLIEGDVHYNKSRDNLTHNNALLAADEVATTLHLNGSKHKIQIDFKYQGFYPCEDGNHNQIEDLIDDLAGNLHNIFFENPDKGCIFLGHATAISLWKRGSDYYMFDSHPIGEDGKSDSFFGVARVFKFQNSKNLATFLINRPASTHTCNVYEIDLVNAVRVQNIERPIFIEHDSSSDDDMPFAMLIDSINKKPAPPTNVGPIVQTELDSSSSDDELPLSKLKEKIRSKLETSSSDDEMPLAVLAEKIKRKTQTDNDSPAKKQKMFDEVIDLVSNASDKPSTSVKKPVGRPKKPVIGRPKILSTTNEEQRNEASKRYNVNHPDIHNEASKRYNVNHPDVHNEASKRYNVNHPDVHNEASKRYNENHPDVHQRLNDEYDKRHPEVNRGAVEKYADNNRGRHVPIELRKDGPIAKYSGEKLNKIEPYRLKNPSLRSPHTYKCEFCSARLFEEERGRLQWCCGQGKNNVLTLLPLTAPFYSDKAFLQHCGKYNDVFAFCALSVPSGYHYPETGISFMKILGRVYHTYYDHCLGLNNSFMLMDGGEPVLSDRKKETLKTHIINEIQSFLQDCNPYISLFKKLHDEPSNSAYLKFEITSRRVHGPVLGDKPASAEMSAVLCTEDCNPPEHKFCIWKHGSNEPKILDANNALIEPFQYPLLYPEGQPGWHEDLLENPTVNEKDEVVEQKKLTLLKYTRCLLLSEERFSMFGRLSEGWLIDAYTRIEYIRLKYLQTVQKKGIERGGLRIGPMDEVSREIANDDTIQGSGRIVPGKIYLPQTFTGGPRYMRASYMKAMALVARYGGPTYFLTFSANGKWQEIKNSINPCSRHEAQICNRVFELKLQELLRDIQSGLLFGKIDYIVHVIEFQMRGLPHAHICFRVSDGGPKQSHEIDDYIRATIPDENEADGRLRQLVLELMMHGPCGPSFRNDLPCWDDKKQYCTKFFPKPPTSLTHIDNEGYVHYQRDPQNKVMRRYKGREYEVNDQWVVPYNPTLLLKYEAHLNLEIASTRRVVKYLFKYINKGPALRRVIVEINGEKETEEMENEIEEYVTKRYIGTTDAAWRVLEFDMTGRNPSVELLPVHLKDQQCVIFKAGHEKEACEKSTSKLMLYFSRPNIEELDNLTYQIFFEKYKVHSQMPKKSKLIPIPYSNNKHFLTKRKRGKCVMRLYWVPRNQTEKYYLRVLLSKFPCRGYEDLYKLGGLGCVTFQDAAKKMGLADDCREYFDCMEEAAQFMECYRLRQLFVMLSTIGAPASQLWEEFKIKLCEDILLKMITKDESSAFKKGLIEIERILRRHGSSLQEAGLPVVEGCSTELEHEIAQYSITEQTEFLDKWVPQLSKDQAAVLNYIISLLQGQAKEKIIFLDGPGGTGKTLLLRVISAYLRSLEKIVLCVATSGIAAQNLIGGTTAHSLFRIPLVIDDTTSWSLTNGSQRAELIEKADLIIFDEAPMAHRKLLELLDRSLKDLMPCKTKLFGGKIFILAGDFRQIPPVVERARTSSDVVNASIRTSHIWKHIKTFKLSTSHRLAGNDDFIDFLMKIGSDKIERTTITIGNREEKLVPLHPQIKFLSKLDPFIDSVFPSEILNQPDECAKRSVICTLNVNAEEINKIILSKISGETHELLSYDTLARDTDDAAASDIDDIHIHEAQGKGIPKHCLQLKINSVCMVMRNLNVDLGMVNGTKVIVVRIETNRIVCRKPGSTELFLIPRITFKFPIFPNSSIEIYRRQFPLQLCSAITIHKSQGQTIDFVGLDLRTPPFAHGQLYVALSRVRSPANMLLLIPELYVKNGVPYTNNVVFKDLL